MSSTDYLRRLVDHGHWANERWMTQLDNQLLSDERLRQLMSHILLSEQVWFQRISGAPLDREIWRTLGTSEMQALHARNRVTYEDLLGHARDRRIAYERFTGERYASTVSDILLHLCLHGMHHRGQMARHASERQLPAPNTDFLNYCIVNGL